MFSPIICLFFHVDCHVSSIEELFSKVVSLKCVSNMFFDTTTAKNTIL